MPVWLEIELAMAMVFGPALVWLAGRFMSLSARIAKLEGENTLQNRERDDIKSTLERMEAKLDELDRKVDALTERVVKVETWVELQRAG